MDLDSGLTQATQSGNAGELWLEPLAEALDTRPDADSRDLARQARQMAAARS